MTSHRWNPQWDRIRLRILARDGRVCAYCGGYANTVDHVVPRIEGGGDHDSNLVAACGSCNSRRSMEWLRANRGRRGPFFKHGARRRESPAGFASEPAHPGPTGALVD